VATEYRKRQDVYTEAATAETEPSVSAELAHTPFEDFADRIAREADEIRAQFASALLEEGGDE
jgi:hypothetical protein